MPVSIVENWTQVVGEVLHLEAYSEAPGFVAVTMEVHSLRAVAGYANLIEQAPGTTLEVLFPQDLVDHLNLSVGDVLSCRVRKAGLERNFVHREHVSLQT
jgi:hypothetical protein